MSNRFLIASLTLLTLLSLPLGVQAQGTAESLGTKPGPIQTAPSLGGTSLQPFFNLTGTLSLSTDAAGITGPAPATIDVDVPAGGSVVKAFLFTANVPGNPLSSGNVSLNGVAVAYDAIVQGMLFAPVYVGRADVTNIVANALIGASPGINSIPYSELATGATDGSALAVIFNDPNAPVSTVSLLFGVQSPGGDTFSVALAAPFDDDEMDIFLSLGISFGYQAFSGTDQASIIEVNGNRMTSSAGGFDDCQPYDPATCNNGQLITIGGVGDSRANPPDPNAGDNNDDRYDDELYTLDPFIPAGATSINIFSQNPSNDDAVFFAGFQFVGATAIVGEGILLTPVQTDAPLGSNVQLRGTVQDDNGDPVQGRTVNFEVISGPNAGQTGSSVTDPLGRAFFNLTSSVAGTDIVEATFIDSNGDPQTSNQARVTWGTTTIPDITVEYISSTRNPRRNDYLVFRTKITNNTASNVPGTLWLDCLNPTGTRLYRTRVVNGTLRPFQMVTIRDKTAIPGNAPAGTYTCTLSAEAPMGTTVYDLDSFTFTLPPLPTLTSTAALPTTASLEATAPEAGPNPFTRETTIRYTLVEDADVQLAVYDVTGREVAALVSGTQNAGAQSAVFSGAGLPAGVYLWRLTIDGQTTTGRVTLSR